MNKKKRAVMVIILVLLIIAAAAFIILLYYKYFPGKADETANGMAIFTENTGSVPVKELINSSLQNEEPAGEPDNPESESSTEDYEQPDAAQEQEDMLQPLTETEIRLADVYTEEGKEAVFYCYDKDAVSYVWEVFDITSNSWVPAREEAVALSVDELYRKVSSFKSSGDGSGDDLMVRCTLQFQDEGAEDIVQTAFLHQLKGSIKDIIPEKYETDANTFICARDIPVKIIYEDNTEEMITGLNGLFFISQEEETEYSTSVSGNKVETITTTISECSYIRIGEEEKKIQMRYSAESGTDIEAEVKIAGQDLKAPVISNIEISPYEITNVDAAVILTISITAEDNVTPYPYLEYAFLLADCEVTEADWRKESTFDVEIEKNGVYVIYVKDESGNISKEEKEIITVDTKAPVIQADLAETDWCKSNTIIVKAKDYSELKYCFTCREDNSSSDWISYDNYTIDKNGTYIVQVKDAAGNIAEEEIVVSNIDKEAPVIREINEK